MNSVADVSREGIKLIEIDQGQLRQHVDGVVRDAVEETLNALLDAEADALCGAKKYERSPDRTDYRAGTYTRTFHTKGSVQSFSHIFPQQPPAQPTGRSGPAIGR